ERVEPRRELLRIGERGEEHAFVPSFGGLDDAERQGGREPRVAIALREAAREQRLAVGAADTRDLLFVEVLAREVGEHGQQRTALAAQMRAEGLEPGLVSAEFPYQ